MKVAGIDVSSFAVDVVLVPADADEETPLEWHHYSLHGTDAWERARSVRDAMPPRTATIWDDVLAIGVENPQARGPAAQNISVLHRVLGGVLACLPAATLVHPWQPAAWRKAVGLPGNATKTDVMFHAVVHENRLRRSWGYPQDVADALCIALATRDAIELEQAA